MTAPSVIEVETIILAGARRSHGLRHNSGKTRTLGFQRPVRPVCVTGPVLYCNCRA
jgi:hypothetical protein